MSKVHLARSGFITKAALPSITRQRGTTTVTSDLMLFGAGKTSVANNTTFIDSSTNAFTVTRVGDTVHSGHNPFSTVSDGSAYFDGTGDVISIPDSTALNLSSGDFTVECWVYINTTTGTQSVIYKGTDSTAVYGTHSIAIISGATAFLCTTSGSAYEVFISGGSLSTGQWYHLAFTRSGSSFRAFINGTQTGSTVTNANNLNTNAGTTLIGAGNPTGSVQNLNGYISNLRIVKGTAVYTSNFTSPTSALTAITNTQLLLLTDNYSIVNSTPTPLPVTIFGNTTISTAQYPTGMTRSIYFDGSGDYLTVPSSSAFAFGTGDFTIEYWIYSISFTTTPTVVDSRNTGVSNNGYSDYFSSGGNFNLYLGSATVFTSSSAIPTSTWTHIAISRSGTSLRVFINGVQNGSTLTNSINFSDTNLLIAVNRGTVANTINTAFFNGYVSNVRIVKGTAVYTGTFTPSAPLSINISVPNNVTNAIYGVNQLA